MADLDPIRQLQHLLDDPDKVLDRIASIQSALGAIKAPNLASSAVTPAAPPASPTPTGSKSEDHHPFDRLLQTLRDMQAQIEERLRPLAQQIVEAEVEYLRQQAERCQSALNECLARIDRTIAACFERIEESRQSYAELTRLHRRLTELGAAAESLPEDAYSQDAAEFVCWRFDKLRHEGKI